MEIVEEPTPRRQARCLLVGLLCVAPVAALADRLALAVTLMIVACIGLFALKRLPECKSQEQSGILVWTDIERGLKLLLVVTGIGLAGFACLLFAIPHFPGCVRPWSNDAAAIATMKNIATAQARFRSNAQLDRDGDGVGEFGYFAELAVGTAVHPPQLSPAFAKTLRIPSGERVVRRSGYYFRMFLLNAEGDGVAEGAAHSEVPDPDQSESQWCCYAWPVQPNDSGKRVLFVNQDGVVLWRHFRGGFGPRQSPAFDAAFARRPRSTADKHDAISTVIAAGTKRRDGHLWMAVR